MCIVYYIYFLYIKYIIHTVYVCACKIILQQKWSFFSVFFVHYVILNTDWPKQKAFGKQWRLIQYCHLLGKNSRDISINIWNFSCFSVVTLFGKHHWKVALAGACLAEIAALTFGHYWSACVVPVGHRPVCLLQFCTLVTVKTRRPKFLCRCPHFVCIACFVFTGDNTAAIQRQESSVAARWAGIVPGLLLPAISLWVSRWGCLVSVYSLLPCS